MRSSSHRVPLARVAVALSTLGVVGAIACSDAATTVRPLDVGSAAFDHGGSGNSGKGDQNHEGKGNQGPGNQNNPKDTVKNNPKDTVKNNPKDTVKNNPKDTLKNNDQRVKLEARLMTVAGDTTFRGAEGHAEFENRTTEMRFKISVENIAAGTVVNFFVGTTMIGSATTRVGGEAELSLETKKGDTVPVVAAGTAVSAQTAAGHVIVSGKF